MAGTSVSIGANGRLLLFIMLVVLLSSLTIVSSASSVAEADCGNVKHEIADKSDASIYILRFIMEGAAPPCDGNAPSDDVAGMHPPQSSSTFLVRLDNGVGRWTKASARG